MNYYIMRRMQGDSFWMLIEGPFSTPELAWRRIDTLRQESSLPCTHDVISMVIRWSARNVL